MGRVTRVGGRKHRKVVIQPRSCEACGQTFTPRVKNQIYCRSACRIEHYRDQDRYLPPPAESTEAAVRDVLSSYIRRCPWAPMSGELVIRW